MSILLDVIKSVKIDFNQTSIFSQGGTGMIDYFDVKPKDFIRFAREDFKQGSRRGLVNSITNAKRAIDCQIDTILQYFGIAFDKIPSESELLINMIENIKSDIPYKLKLIQALKFSPSSLTNRARTLRNKLEHYYQIPEEREIEESIEIAELFILSCESKTKMVDDNFIISSEKFTYQAPHLNIEGYSIDKLSNQIEVSFDYQNKTFIIEPTIDNIQTKTVYFDHKTTEFYFLLRLVNSNDDKTEFLESLIMLLEHIKHPIPPKNVRIYEWC